MDEPRTADAGPRLPLRYAAPGAHWVRAGDHAEPVCRFRVWAPSARRVRVHLLGEHDRFVRLNPVEAGFHEGDVAGIKPGQLYKIRLDGGVELPDPASRWQPQGVHGPSAVAAAEFAWTDAAWRGIPLSQYVLYELHVGTFTPQGTLDAIGARLRRLRELGVTAIELMPLAQFPGNRNWGYDGVYPFAVQDSYGGPEALKRFVDACHATGLAVVLDVVYNHLGPEGNYLAQFGPYFTDRYHTPWGKAINFDGRQSDAVRDYFLHNAAQWIREFHIDALRLDAVHAIFDRASNSFLSQLGELVRHCGAEAARETFCIAESNQNDPGLTQSRRDGGYGIDAQWNDDFHRSLHTLVTGEASGYFIDYGRMRDLAKALTKGFVLSGDYSRYRNRDQGKKSGSPELSRLVVFAQNHDQTGNRRLGERLTALAPPEALKLVAVMTLLSPCLPMLFMGEEYGETAPFLYFVSHGDPQLVEAVRAGRKRDFASFAWKDEAPDPQDPQTFASSKLSHDCVQQPWHAMLWRLHQRLAWLRREVPTLGVVDRTTMRGLHVEADDDARTLVLVRRSGNSGSAMLANFSETARTVSLPFSQQGWRLLLDSASTDWLGPGSAMSEQISGGVESQDWQVLLGPWSAAVFAER